MSNRRSAAELLVEGIVVATTLVALLVRASVTQDWRSAGDAALGVGAALLVLVPLLRLLRPPRRRLRAVAQPHDARR